MVLVAVVLVAQDFGDQFSNSEIAPGGRGTSYSGGSGSGGTDSNGNVAAYSSAGSDIGGPGGNGCGSRNNVSWMARNGGGGAGNPGGFGGLTVEGSSKNTGNDVASKGADGTGGLLIIYCDTLSNYGLVSSKGTDNSVASGGSGGASGGGSINVFYKELKNKGEFNVTGGKSTNYGGAGGDGTFTVGRIENGTFIKE